MKTFKEFVDESTVEMSEVEKDNINQHMASKDYNVTKIHSKKNWGEVTHHVAINNLPTDKNGMVPEQEFIKAQTHLDKLGTGALLHTKQKINTTVGKLEKEINPDVKRAGSSINWTGD